MAIIIAAESANITVHANKAIPDSGAGYLALPLRKHIQQVPEYQHYVPGCGSGRPFLSVVTVYDETCVSVDKLGAISSDGQEQEITRLDFRTLQVYNKQSHTSTKLTQ